jgi:Flp pilus assembly protein TadD
MNTQRILHTWTGTAAAIGVLFLGACTTVSDGRPGVAAADGAGKPASALTRDALDARFSQADRALAGGEAELAYKLYSHILKQHPADPRAQLGMAEAHLAARDGEQAYRLFRLIEAAGEPTGRTLQGQGIALVMLGRHDEALPMLEGAVRADPSLWRAWNALGQIHDMRRQWDLAGQSYGHALAANPSAAAVHNNLGVSLLLQGRGAEAAQAFGKALQLDRHLKPAQGNLRLALAGQGRYGEALAGIDPQGWAVALNNVGYIAMTQGDLGTAETLLMGALEKSPTFYDKASRNLEEARALRRPEPGR